jgi:hypothetical protein
MDNPDEAEKILAELAIKGVIDDPSLAVATANSPDQIDVTLDAMKSEKKFMYGITKSVDRRQQNQEFVSSSNKNEQIF